MKLVVEPLISIKESLTRTIVVIDGIDEYQRPGHDNTQVPVGDLINILMSSFQTLPISILFATRPEAYIKEIFNGHRALVLQVDLKDFQSTEDVRRFLLSALREAQQRRLPLLEWPPEEDVQVLSRRSEGFFIFAQTVVRIIDGEHNDPREILRLALRIRDGGLYVLYRQILDTARSYPNFNNIFGAVLVLFDGLGVSDAAQLLRTDADSVRLALRGCESVLYVPKSNENHRIGIWETATNYLRPFHASLKDFLGDPDEAGALYRIWSEDHEFLLSCCLDRVKTWLSRPVSEADPPTSCVCPHVMPAGINKVPRYSLGYFLLHFTSLLCRNREVGLLKVGLVGPTVVRICEVFELWVYTVGNYWRIMHVWNSLMNFDSYLVPSSATLPTHKVAILRAAAMELVEDLKVNIWMQYVCANGSDAYPVCADRKVLNPRFLHEADQTLQFTVGFCSCPTASDH